MNKVAAFVLAGLVLALGGWLAGCQSSETAYGITELEARVAALEEQVERLEQQLSASSASADSSDAASLQAAVSELEGEVQSVWAYMENTVGPGLSTVEQDIESLHRIVCYSMGRPIDYFGYIEERFGKFEFEARHGGIVIELPGAQELMFRE